MPKAKHNRIKKNKFGHKILSTHNDWKKRTSHAKEQIRLAVADKEAQEILGGVNLLSGVKNFVKDKVSKAKEKIDNGKNKSDKRK